MTDKYAVIGNPIAHSKSPQIHRMFAEQTGQDISYESILAPPGGFASVVERLRKEGYKGCNVTVPFKFEAFNLANQNLSIRANAAQAANTLKFYDQTIFGDNTDGAGLITDIESNLKISLRDKRVLLIGAGGAAWGVALPLLLQVPGVLIISNRTSSKAEDLLRHVQDQQLQHHEAAAFSGLGKSPTNFSSKSFSDLAGEEFDLVINATSSGLSGEMPPLPPDIFAPGALAYDMMYGGETPFMAFAREHGAAAVSDGLGMLVEQAAESFFIWRGVHPETRPVIAALRMP